jgi:hypothetical protein
VLTDPATELPQNRQVGGNDINAGHIMTL